MTDTRLLLSSFLDMCVILFILLLFALYTDQINAYVISAGVLLSGMVAGRMIGRIVE